MSTDRSNGLAAKSGEFAIGGDLRVARLGYGAMRITGKGIWGEPRDRPEAVRVLRRAVEFGINFIDTADAYGPNVSEEIIAEALHPYPAGLVIATKGGFERPGPDKWVENGKPEHLKSALSVASHRSEGSSRGSARGSEGSAGARQDQAHRPIGSERPPDQACAKHRADRERAESL
jgi:hypothetical protein